MKNFKHNHFSEAAAKTPREQRVCRIQEVKSNCFHSLNRSNPSQGKFSNGSVKETPGLSQQRQKGSLFQFNFQHFWVAEGYTLPKWLERIINLEQSMDMVRKMFLLQQALKFWKSKNSERQRPWKWADNPGFPRLWCLCSSVFFRIERETHS